MNLKLLKKGIDELVDLCLKDNIDLKNVHVDLVDDIICVNTILPNTIRKVKIESKIDNSYKDIELLKKMLF